MKFHGFFDNFMISNGNHDILCFQPSATLHETLKILRKKHGFQTAELAARKDKPRRLPACGEEMSWEPTENLGIPYVS